MHAAIDTLEALAGELRDLLERLGEPGDTPWQGPWERSQALFGRLRAENPNPAELGTEEREAFTQRLEEVVRLNALAAAMVVRESDRLSEDLRRLTVARRGLQKAVGQASAGASCDVQG